MLIRFDRVDKSFDGTVVLRELSFDVSDRVMMLDEGRIVEEAPPEKLFTEPDQPRTREFLRAVLDRA